MPNLSEAEDWQGWKLMRRLLIEHDFDWGVALAELRTHTENPGHTRTFNEYQRKKVVRAARDMKNAGPNSRYAWS